MACRLTVHGQAGKKMHWPKCLDTLPSPLGCPTLHTWSLLAHHKSNSDQNIMVCGRKDPVHLHSSHCPLSIRSRVRWSCKQRFSEGVSQRVMCLTTMQTEGPTPGMWTRIFVSRAQICSIKTSSLVILMFSNIWEPPPTMWFLSSWPLRTCSQLPGKAGVVRCSLRNSN